MFLLNSRLGLFTAAPLSPLEQVLRLEGASLLPKLRDYFAEFLNEKSLERLRIFSLPTCVGLRYGHQAYSLRGFSWQRGIKKLACPKARFPAFLRDAGDRIFHVTPPTIAASHPIGCISILLRPPITQTHAWWCRNIDLLSIIYAFRPRLRHRLTLGGLTYPRKP